MVEHWRQIADHENYMISSLGNVMNITTKRLLTSHEQHGYKKITLNYTIDGIIRHFNLRIHRLVAEAFIPNPENKKEVNHKNRNKQDNTVENLEWATPSENMRHHNASGGNRHQVELQMMHSETGEVLVFSSLHEAGRHFNLKSATMWGYSITGRWNGWIIERVITNRMGRQKII
jgi:hypothetical protein